MLAATSTRSALFGMNDATSSRCPAMLMGSLIGDALGGPIEFLPPERARSVMPDARSWAPTRIVDADSRNELSESLAMHSYADLRPDTAPYGPWQTRAARGTITDDSRHKIVLMRGLRTMLSQQRHHFTQEDLARQLIAFRPHEEQEPDQQLAALVEEGLREYRFASHWILGSRDPRNALPVERLWSGIANCSGQMMLIPLACLFPGDPQRAYRETYRIDFVDAPLARDIASAINAGLAAAIDPKLDGATADRRWAASLDAMRIDPYRMNDVPFAGRPLDRWLDLSDSLVKRSGGRPATLYELLETEGDPVYFWDAHFTLLVPLTMLKFCEFDPLSAMHLTLDFGHDTDSYAQVLGAMIGAVHGMDIFPASMSNAVASCLMADYGESVDQWARTLAMAGDVWNDTNSSE